MPDPGAVIEVTPGRLRDWPLPSHRDWETTDDRGHVPVVGGAAQTPGAVLLAGVASLRAEAGRLAVATAVWGAHLHGSAGDRLATRLGRVGYLAREVADEVPQVLSMYDQ